MKTKTQHYFVFTKLIKIEDNNFEIANYEELQIFEGEITDTLNDYDENTCKLIGGISITLIGNEYFLLSQAFLDIIIDEK